MGQSQLKDPDIKAIQDAQKAKCEADLLDATNKYNICKLTNDCPADYNLKTPGKRTASPTTIYSIRDDRLSLLESNKTVAVQIDSDGRMESLLFHRGKLFVKTNDRRFGVLERAGNIYKFKTLETLVEDVFLYDEGLFISKDTPGLRSETAVQLFRLPSDETFLVKSSWKNLGRFERSSKGTPNFKMESGFLVGNIDGVRPVKQRKIPDTEYTRPNPSRCAVPRPISPDRPIPPGVRRDRVG